MIICRDCGHENEEDDQFCGSCGAFLEWTGAKVEEAAPLQGTQSEGVETDPTLLERVKKAVGVDDESIEEHRQTVHQQLADETADDQTVADQINAEREAKAEAERRAVAEEAARVSAEKAERERREAEEAVQKAEADAERLRLEAERAETERVAKAAAERARLEREAKLAAEAEQARRLQEIEEAKRSAEAAAEQARQRAEEDARVQQAAAEEAQRREEEAERHRKEAEEKVAIAAAAAAAAALRAAQETDAIAAAEAAKQLAEADTAKARSEAEAATALAQEEAARARSELAAAKAESAKLRNEAEQRAADEQIQKARSDAEVNAARAREDAERKAAADAEMARRTAEADAEAAAIRSKAEADAKAKEAEAEAMRLRAEAAAAKARAEAEQARQKAEAEAAARAREEALKRAAALVAKPQEAASSGAGSASSLSTSAKPGASSSSGKTAGSPSGTPTAKDAGKGSPSGTAGNTTVQPAAVIPGTSQPQAQRPGAEKVRPAAKKSAAQEINPGDLICGNCGTGNPPTRKFCRKCGTTLAEAIVAKVGFFARLKRKFSRKKKSHEAGYRPKAGSAGANAGLATKGRVAWFRLNSKLMKVGALLGVVAAFGFGVEPIRQKLQLPNVRQSVMNKFRELAKPVYDPVRPASAKASSAASGHGAEFAIDAGSNTYWSAGPAADGGIGSKLTISFDKPFDLGRVLLTSGVSGSNEPGAGFVSQPRPSELRFTLNDDVANAVTVGVKDIPEPQQLVVKGKEVTKLVMEVTGVYPSAQGKGKSVSITEMEFFQKRKFGDDFETLPLSKTAVTSGNELAKYLTDNDLATAWVSAADNDGVDQGFTLNFSEPVDLDRIRIAGGSSETDFKASPRPHEMQLVLTCERACEPTKQVSLKDKWGYKNVELTARGVTSIQFQVRSVYGAGGGVSVAEVQLQRKRPKPL